MQSVVQLEERHREDLPQERERAPGRALDHCPPGLVAGGQRGARLVLQQAQQQAPAETEHGGGAVQRLLLLVHRERCAL